MTSGRVGARGRALDCVDATGPRVGRETSGSEADHGTIGNEVAHGRVVATGARLCSRVRRRASGERVGRLVEREASGSEADHGTIGDEVARGRVAATGARLCSPRVRRESRAARRPIMAQGQRRRVCASRISGSALSSDPRADRGRARPRVRGELRACEVGGRRGKNGRVCFLNKAGQKCGSVGPFSA
jgi:hypothetical protein